MSNTVKFLVHFEDTDGSFYITDIERRMVYKSGKKQAFDASKVIEKFQISGLEGSDKLIRASFFMGDPKYNMEYIGGCHSKYMDVHISNKVFITNDFFINKKNAGECTHITLCREKVSNRYVIRNGNKQEQLGDIGSSNAVSLYVQYLKENI